MKDMGILSTVNVFIAILVACVTGCQTRYQSPKERSYLTAMQILRTSDEQDMIYKIKSCDDVDALRIIAFTASAAAWPMEAGSDVSFDSKMDGIAITSIGRLYAIASDSANASIEYYKHAFPPDGVYSLSFKEWEEERKSLRPQRKSDVRKPNTTTISPKNYQP